MFTQDTVAYNDVSQYWVWLQKVQRFKCLTLAVTLTLNTAIQYFQRTICFVFCFFVFVVLFFAYGDLSSNRVWLQKTH